MKTRIVHTKIWDDEWFQNLELNAKHLFIYLITCQDINICGIFELSDRKITYHTGLSGVNLQQLKKSLIKKVIFYNGWVCIKNTDKFNSFKGPKNDSARVNELLKVPTDVMDYIRSSDTSMDTSIYTTLNTNHNLNLNTNQKVTREFLEQLKKDIGEKLRLPK